MSVASSMAQPSQMKPFTWRPSSVSSVPMPSGAGISATKLPNSLTGSFHSSISMAAPSAPLISPGLGGVVLARA